MLAIVMGWEVSKEPEPTIEGLNPYTFSTSLAHWSLRARVCTIISVFCPNLPAIASPVNVLPQEVQALIKQSEFTLS